MGNRTWVFDDDADVAVVASRGIFAEHAPILFASLDDEGWGFTDGSEPTLDNGILVGLGEIVDVDPSICELADLPLNWRAWRESPGGVWHREPIPVVNQERSA